jgi:hypothetical protein
MLKNSPYAPNHDCFTKKPQNFPFASLRLCALAVKKTGANPCFKFQILYRTNVIARRFAPKQSPVYKRLQLKRRLPRRRKPRAAARNDINL